MTIELCTSPGTVLRCEARSTRASSTCHQRVILPLRRLVPRVGCVQQRRRYPACVRAAERAARHLHLDHRGRAVRHRAVPVVDVLHGHDGDLEPAGVGVGPRQLQLGDRGREFAGQLATRRAAEAVPVRVVSTTPGTAGTLRATVGCSSVRPVVVDVARVVGAHAVSDVPLEHRRVAELLSDARQRVSERLTVGPDEVGDHPCLVGCELGGRTIDPEPERGSLVAAAALVVGAPRLVGQGGLLDGHGGGSVQSKIFRPTALLTCTFATLTRIALSRP